jgi:hypoxia up-regulated 1
MQAEDWLYTDGEHATAAEFKMRLEALESSVKPIFFRYFIIACLLLH